MTLPREAVARALSKKQALVSDAVQQPSESPAGSNAASGIAHSKRLRRGRRFRYLLYTVCILLLLEGLAWTGDALFHFRRTLLFALHLTEIVNEPISGKSLSDLPAPDVISVRPHNDPPSPNRPYVIGGRVIPHAAPSTGELLLRPADVVDPGEKRVFIVGGSAAYGFPYRYEDTFAAVLQRELARRGYRVVNAARVGATSGELVPVVRRIVDHYDPHTLIIFTGNNEWIHWSPCGQVWISKRSRAVLRTASGSRAVAAIALATLKLSGRLRRTAHGEDAFISHRELTGISYALQHPSDLRQFDPRQWAETKKNFLDTFEGNVAEMIRHARGARVRVIVLTLPFNYKLSPVWKHPQPHSHDREHEQRASKAIKDGVHMLQTGRAEDALREADAALRLDSTSAVLHYLKGQSLESLERFAEAEDAYAQCREHMIGNLGSPLSINDRIRKAAAATGARLIDVRKLFDEHEHAEGRHFNEDLIHDDCHPTPVGHQIIAQAVLRLFDDRRSEP